MTASYQEKDTLDDTAAIARALEAAKPGQTVKLTPGKVFQCEGQIVIPAGVTLECTGAKLHFAANRTKQGVVIGGSKAGFRGGAIVGPQFIVYTDGQVGISASPPSTRAPYFDVVIEDVEISGFGQAGMDLTFLERFRLSRYNISRCFRHGVALRSCRNGRVQDFETSSINADGKPAANAYGLSLTKSVGSEEGQPVCHDIGVSGGKFQDIRTWWAIDTHGGYNLDWSDLTFRDVRGAVSVTSYIGTPGSERAPANVHVSNVRGYTSHGSDEAISRAHMSAGISISGDPGSGKRATNIVLDGYEFDGFGDATNDLADNNAGTINIQYADVVSIPHGGPLRNNGSWGYFIRGVTRLAADSIGLVTGLAGRPDGAAAVQVAQLAGGKQTSGTIAGLQADVGSNAGIRLADENPGLTFRNNKHLGNGPLYTGKGFAKRGP